MASLNDEILQKRKVAAIVAVSAAATTVAATAYLLLDTPREWVAINEMVEKMNAKLDAITKSIDPMYFANMLYAEVMVTEGFSSKYLDRAFAFLMRDYLEGQIFLARNKESRKKMLEGLREKIGNI